MKLNGEGPVFRTEEEPASELKKMDAPMALMSGIKGCVPRSGLNAIRSRRTPTTHADAMPASTARPSSAGCGKRKYGAEGAEHVDLTLGKIDNAQDAVNHGVAKGDQRIHAAHHKAVHKLLDQHITEPLRISRSSP